MVVCPIAALPWPPRVRLYGRWQSHVGSAGHRGDAQREKRECLAHGGQLAPMEVGAGGGNAEHNPPPLSKKPVGDACKVYENKKGQLKTCRIGDTHWRNAVPDCVDPGFWLR